MNLHRYKHGPARGAHYRRRQTVSQTEEDQARRASLFSPFAARLPDRTNWSAWADRREEVEA